MTDYAISESQADLENNWLLLYQLAARCYISNDMWIKFFNECSHWYFNDTLGMVCTDKKIAEHEYQVIPITADYISSVCK